MKSEFRAGEGRGLTQWDDRKLQSQRASSAAESQGALTSHCGRCVRNQDQHRHSTLCCTVVIVVVEQTLHESHHVPAFALRLHPQVAPVHNGGAGHDCQQLSCRYLLAIP